MNAPTLGEIDISLSLSMTRMLASISPALFNASNAIPAVIAPSPMIETTSRSKPCCEAATAMPKAALIDVLECPAPNVSYWLSLRFKKPDKPPG